MFTVHRGVPRLSFPAWCKYLTEVASAKKMEVNLIKNKLINCGPPGVTDGTVTRFLKGNILLLCKSASVFTIRGGFSTP